MSVLYYIFLFCFVFLSTTLIEIFWQDLTFKQQNSRIYCSAGTPVLLLSTLAYSEVALECLQSGKSGNFVVKSDQKISISADTLYFIVIFPNFNTVSHTSVKSNEKIPMFHYGFGKSLTFIKAFSEESFMFTAHSAHFQATCSSSRYIKRFFVRVGHETTYTIGMHLVEIP